jgi:hypothetical protein
MNALLVDPTSTQPTLTAFDRGRPILVVQCPMCGEGELASLGVTLTLRGGEALMSCPCCRSFGSLAELEERARKHARRSAEPRTVGGCCSYRAAVIPELAVEFDAEIEACLREDARKGEKGGGGSNSVKRQPKPGDKLLKVRPEQEQAPLKFDRPFTAQRVDGRNISHQLRITTQEADILDDLAELYQKTLSDLVRHAALWWAREAALGKGFIGLSEMPTGPKVVRIVRWTGQEAALVSNVADVAGVSFAEAIRISTLVWVHTNEEDLG